MDENRLHYDRSTRTLRYAANASDGEPLDTELGLKLSKLARSGSYAGEPVRELVVVFASQESARQNADALEYLKLGAEGPDGRVKSRATFESRDDFGLSDD